MKQLTKTCERCLKCLVISEGSVHTCTPPSEYWANVEQQRDKLLAALKVAVIRQGFTNTELIDARAIIKEIEKTK